MYCSVRQYKLKASENIDELIGKVRDQFLPIVTKADGFVSYSVAVTDKAELITAGFFADRKGAEDSVSAASEWVRDNVAASLDGPPKITSGEVLAFERKGGDAHFGVLRRMTLHPGKRDEALEIISAKLFPMIKNVSGFISSAVIAGGADQLLVIGAYRDRASSEEVTRLAMPFMQQNAGQLMAGPPEMTDGEIKLRYVTESAIA